jgi:hypothetical protein
MFGYIESEDFGKPAKLLRRIDPTRHNSGVRWPLVCLHRVHHIQLPNIFRFDDGEFFSYYKSQQPLARNDENIEKTQKPESGEECIL